MKYLGILTLLLFTTYNAECQLFVEGVDILNEPGIAYCQIEVKGKSEHRQVKVDYGQEPAKSMLLTDKEGEPLYFYSDIHALNYFRKHGYAVQTTIPPDPFTNNFRFILTKVE